jgi:vacuolar iron transporter family protein
MTDGARSDATRSDAGGRAEAAGSFDRARLRGLVVDGNDGIMATAGIVEGFIGAGAATETIVVAAIAAMVAGAIAMGSAKYSEAAIERDATNALIAEERRQLSLSPAEELAELAAIYERRGLSPELARTVAMELSAHDALAAHAEAEHDIALDDASIPPLVVGITAAASFAIGSLVVLLSVGITWSTRLPTTFFAVAISLSLTSIVVARWGNLPVLRTMARTVGVGVIAMLITFAIGTRIDQ